MVAVRPLTKMISPPLTPWVTRPSLCVFGGNMVLPKISTTKMVSGNIRIKGSIILFNL